MGNKGNQIKRQFFNARSGYIKALEPLGAGTRIEWNGTDHTLLVSN